MAGSDKEETPLWKTVLIWIIGIIAFIAVIYFIGQTPLGTSIVSGIGSLLKSA